MFYSLQCERSRCLSWLQCTMGLCPSLMENPSLGILPGWSQLRHRRALSVAPLISCSWPGLNLVNSSPFSYQNLNTNVRCEARQ